MTESQYKQKLKQKLYKLFPGCVVLLHNPQHIQGFPDLLILYKDKWAALEVKLSFNSDIQPNQKYYVDFLDDMSFSSFINPENEEEVLYELEKTFGRTLVRDR